MVELVRLPHIPPESGAEPYNGTERTQACYIFLFVSSLRFLSKNTAPKRLDASAICISKCASIPPDAAMVDPKYLQTDYNSDATLTPPLSPNEHSVSFLTIVFVVQLLNNFSSHLY